MHSFHTQRAAIGLLGAALLLGILGNKGCDREPPQVADGGGSAAACTPTECGPAPGAPNHICADGSVAGPGPCQRGASGKCAWTFRECPDAGHVPGKDGGGTMHGKDAGNSAHDGGRPMHDAGGAAHDAGHPVHDGGSAAHDSGHPMHDGGNSAPDAAAKRCGTRGGVQCSAGDFCNFEPDTECGATDKGGVCETRPQICQTLYKPVCGCDNRSYSNACAAHAAGVSAQHEGLCTPDECVAAGGHAVTGTGGSTPACAGGEESWNVSGGVEAVICCRRTTLGKTCGGIASLMCGAGEFCNYEVAAGGQGCDGSVADAGGTCQTIPSACTEPQAPVCGCDRRSYGNACEAHAGGAAVLHEGACTEIDCAAIGGHVVDGIGPGPMCPPGETQHTYIRYSNGMIAIEGSACCVP